MTVLFQHPKVSQLPEVDDEEYFCLLALCVKSSGQLFYHGVGVGGEEIFNVHGQPGAYTGAP